MQFTSVPASCRKKVSMVLSQHGFLAPTRPSTKPSQGNQHLLPSSPSRLASEDLPGSQCLLHCAVSCTAALSCPVYCIGLRFIKGDLSISIFIDCCMCCRCLMLEVCSQFFNAHLAISILVHLLVQRSSMLLCSLSEFTSLCLCSGRCKHCSLPHTILFVKSSSCFQDFLGSRLGLARDVVLCVKFTGLGLRHNSCLVSVLLALQNALVQGCTRCRQVGDPAWDWAHSKFFHKLSAEHAAVLVKQVVVDTKPVFLHLLNDVIDVSLGFFSLTHVNRFLVDMSLASLRRARKDPGVVGCVAIAPLLSIHFNSSMISTSAHCL
mmetsp:Transcript_51034/g.81496  ORF Transcript_51034/g.81496 Transcript_51034/m.81496 type:complete len:321 (+) Transcript_51034:30-992(+)